jgi:hypothetical protein
MRSKEKFTRAYNILKDNKPYGIYHACGSGHTSWYGFAKKIMEFANIDTKVIYDKLELYSGMSKSDIEEDLAKKKEILQWMIDSDFFDIETVGKIISQYYMGILDMDSWKDQQEQNSMNIKELKS